MKTKSTEAASAKVQAKVAETFPMRDKINGLRSQNNRLRANLPAYDAIDKKLVAIPWPKVMQTIGDTLPAKVRISDISTTDSGDFTLRGEALGERYVHQFAKELQNDELIESAKVEEIGYDGKRNAILVNYKIICKIRMSESDL